GRGGDAADAARRLVVAQRNRRAHVDRNAREPIVRHAHVVTPPDRTAAEDIDRHHGDGARGVAIDVERMPRRFGPPGDERTIYLLDVALARTKARTPRLAGRPRGP